MGGIAARALILRPMVLSSRPVDEAVARWWSVLCMQESPVCHHHHRVLPMMPYIVCVSSTVTLCYSLYALTFPTPLMTPPDTSTYFMIAFSALATVWGREGRNLKVAARHKKFVASAHFGYCGARWPPELVVDQSSQPNARRLQPSTSPIAILDCKKETLAIQLVSCVNALLTPQMPSPTAASSVCYPTSNHSLPLLSTNSTPFIMPSNANQCPQKMLQVS